MKDRNRLPTTFLGGCRFGKLVVLPVWRRDMHGNVTWLAACDCPNKTKRWVPMSGLTSGAITCCAGCLPKKPAPVVEDEEEPEPLDRLEMLELRLRARFVLTWVTSKRGRWYGVFDSDHDTTELCGETKQAALDRIEEIVADELRHAALPAFCRTG
jgi:hypothetical protein